MSEYEGFIWQINSSSDLGVLMMIQEHVINSSLSSEEVYNLKWAIKDRMEEVRKNKMWERFHTVKLPLNFP